METDLSPLQQDAQRYLRSYRGNHRFLRDLARLAQNESWAPTLKQAQATIKCRAYQGQGYGGGAPRRYSRY